LKSNQELQSKKPLTPSLADHKYFA